MSADDSHDWPDGPNPYDALDLDPSLDLATLTEQLRERAEDLDPDERAHIQGLWQALTVHPRSRAFFAMLARQRVERADDPAQLVEAIRDLEGEAAPARELLDMLEPADLALPPSYMPGRETSRRGPHELPDVPIDEDPFFELDDE